MPFLKFRNSGRRIPRSARMRRRTRVRRSRRRPMTTGKVKRIIDAELKVRDLSVEDIPIPNTTGLILHLTSIDQGDLNNQRTGNWIKPTSWMGTITVQGNEVANPDIVPLFRLAIFQWKENETLNAAIIGKIMQDVVDPHQQFNIQNKGQFKILWSRTGILSNQNSNPQFAKMFRFYVKPPMKVLYDGDAFKNNHLFLLAYSDIDTVDNPPTITLSQRLRYTDS